MENKFTLKPPKSEKKKEQTITPDPILNSPGIPQPPTALFEDMFPDRKPEDISNIQAVTNYIDPTQIEKINPKTGEYEDWIPEKHGYRCYGIPRQPNGEMNVHYYTPVMQGQGLRWKGNDQDPRRNDATNYVMFNDTVLGICKLERWQAEERKREEGTRRNGIAKDINGREIELSIENVDPKQYELTEKEKEEVYNRIHNNKPKGKIYAVGAQLT